MLRKALIVATVALAVMAPAGSTYARAARTPASCSNGIGFSRTPFLHRTTS